MHILSIDIGGSAIKYGILNTSGQILHKGSVINERTSLEVFMATLCSVVEVGMAKYPIKGIALSVPAIMNSQTGMILSEGSMPFLVGVNLMDELQNKYAIDVFSENDGNCAALAEVWKGVAKDCNDIAVVVIGTGVGGALVKDKLIHPGTNFMAGEFGYFINSFDFEAKAFEIWSDLGATYALTDKLSKIKGQTLTGLDVFELASNHDPVAIKEIDNFYNSNAVGMFNLQYFFDPEMIVLGGAISKRKDFVDQLESRLDTIFNKIEIAPKRPVIKVAEFGNDANLIGAVYNYLTQKGCKIYK
ncbi:MULTISPECIES: ROK family protein [unclassified Fusibacter]|uniref:ROK family protein n=1 Tax=unclassified Fusibacter TaxID=2624464 RepID=UPI001010CE4F|nr:MULTISPECIES: ROK family protein [unclassified Fusibacter]MCK8061671.1 ROK family protein [Fusibacter sp. A2]NPE23855.1 ROK family protein [Fusibacter sp. A1]RXV58570.1 ROK family protein [Fusibacter sp. A1]